MNQPGDEPDVPDAPDDADAVGSVAEEAAKLFGAVTDWAREHGTETGQDRSDLAGPAASDGAADGSGPARGAQAGLGGLAGLAGLAGAASVFAEGLRTHLGDRVATGSAECAYCPVCRTVHVFRTNPEVRAHLTAAASSLVQAASGLLATLPPSSGTPRRTARRTADVEKIDLDLDAGWDEDS